MDFQAKRPKFHISLVHVHEADNRLARAWDLTLRAASRSEEALSKRAASDVIKQDNTEETDNGKPHQAEDPPWIDSEGVDGIEQS